MRATVFDGDQWRSLTGMGILLGLGWVLLAFNVVRAIQSDASLTSRFVGTAIPIALALVLFAGAFGIVVYGLLDRALLIARWTLLGTVSLTVAIALNILAFDSVRPDFLLALFMVVNGAGGGAAFGFLIGLYDAHQHRLRSDLGRERERAMALSQRLSVINRVLRHDIRNQAQIIAGFADQWDSETGEQADAIERVQRASERLKALSAEARQLQSLLDGSEFDREVVDLCSLVREAGTTVQSVNPALTVEYDLPDERQVYASAGLGRAIKHLLSNAVEHNDSADPRATVTVTTTDDDPPVRLTIADNGPGLPEHEPVAAGDVRESQLHHSDGIGLWFAKWAVEDSGGELTVEDGEDGTAVTIMLPAADEPA